MPSHSRLIRPLLARFFVLSMVFLHGFFLWTERDYIRRGYPDFSIFYTAGKMVRSGLAPQLYSARAQFQVQQQFTSTDWLGPLPFNHPPFEILPFIPFTYLPYVTGFVLWNSINLAALFSIVILLRRHSRFLAGISVLDCWLALLAFFPVFATLLQGQDSIFLLLLFVLGYDALTRRADALAGVFFGIALFKFQFPIPLVLLLLLWGKRKTGATFLATGAVLGAISACITGWNGLLVYPRFLARVAATPLAGRTPPDVMANLHGLVEGWGSWPPPRLGLLLVLLVSLAAFLCAANAGRKLAGDWPAAFSFAVLTSILVSYQLNPHDLTLLVLPLVLLLDRTVPALAAGKWNWRLAAPVLPLLISPVWITVWLGWGHTNVFVLLLIWWTVVIAANRNSPPVTATS